MPRAPSTVVFDTITSSLRKNDDVRLVGFGTFTVTKRAASEGRNPRTGEKFLNMRGRDL